MEEELLKILATFILVLFLSGCYTATLETPKKYDIYLTNIDEEDVFDYAKYMAKQSYYTTHKVLVINKDYAEISYTSKLAPEMVFQKTQKFFGYAYPVKLNSNVIKVEGTANEIH